MDINTNNIYDLDKILDYNQEELTRFFRFSAGLSNSNFGGNQAGTVGGEYNLKLQQIPEEYSAFLLFLRGLNKNSYLELGVGQGGSFLVNCLFQKTTKVFHAVDNCYYLQKHIEFFDQRSSILQRIEEIKDFKENSDVKFFDKSTDDFFENNNIKYDIIFIDADHDYKGAKKDYENSLDYLNDGGYVIFHDIANKSCGVKKLWDEIENSKKLYEFISGDKCGIGVLNIKN